MCSRRSFLAAGALLRSAIAADSRGPRKPAARQAKVVYLFFDQSGDPYNPTKPSYVGGVLATGDLLGHHHDIEEIRVKHNFCLTMRYNGANKAKLPFAEDVLRYFLATPDLHFTAKIIKTFSTDEPLPVRQKIHIAQCRSVLDDVLRDYAAAIPCKIQVASQNLIQEEFDQYIVALRPRLERLSETNFEQLCPQPERAPDNNNNLIQLCDFLTGTVYGDASGSANSVNTDLIAALRKQLGVAKLSDGSLADHPKFRVVLRV